MKKITTYLRLLIIIVVLGSGCTQFDSQSKLEAVTLNRVIDGDTVEVIHKGETKKLRLLLIDTPELKHPQTGKQPYSEEATKLTRELLENASLIQIEFDIGQRIDKYGRSLVYLYADGEMVQKKLLEVGYAQVAYVYPPNTRYLDELRTIEETAKNKKLGIWSIGSAFEENPENDNEPTDSGEPPKGCTIKGNINSKGDKIYHMPGTTFYERTEPEKWFCTEQEAINDGFRAPK